MTRHSHGDRNRSYLGVRALWEGWGEASHPRRLVRALTSWRLFLRNEGIPLRPYLWKIMFVYIWYNLIYTHLFFLVVLTRKFIDKNHIGSLNTLTF